MAFVANTTNQTGTVSVVAGGVTVTGIGTNFTSANIGTALVVGTQWGFITSVASTTSCTLDFPFATGVTAQAYSYVTTFTQSGTDTSLVGLQGLRGVRWFASKNATQAGAVDYYLGESAVLTISGTLTHDPDYECMTLGAITALVITGTYNYGIARTINSQISYSKGVGLNLTGGYFLTAGAFNLNGGTINWNGGVIRCGSAPVISSGRINTTGDFCTLMNTATGGAIQLRSASIGTQNLNRLRLSGISNPVYLFSTSAYINVAAIFEFGAIQATASGGPNQVYSNPSFANNQNTSDVIYNQGSNNIQTMTLLNADRYPNIGKLSTAAYGVTEVQETFSTTITNTSNANIQNAVVYIKDSNNLARLNPTVAGGNSYTADRVYIAASNASGLASLGNILTGVFQNLNTTSNTINADYRANGGNGSYNFNINYWSYNELYASTSQSLKGNNGVSLPWTLFNDSNVTLSRTNAIAKLASSFTVNPTTKVVTITANSTYDDIYDVLKAYKCTATQVNLETPTIDTMIVSADGTNLNAYTGWTLVINTGVTLSSGTKFTKVKFDTVTINGTGSIIGIYQTSAGTSTIWEFGSVSEPIIAGTSLAIYDSTGTTKYYNAVTSNGVYRYYIAPQSTGATYTYAIERYGYKREEGTFPSNAGGILFYVPSYGEDVGITQATLATVQAYTTLSDTAQIYDATANFRLSETGIKLGQLVARDGTYLDFGNYNVKIKDDNASIVSVASGTITYKSIVVNESTKYNAMKATPPKTITANDSEIINVLIEDANGDSKLEILGGDNDSYELWKIPTTTATDDYATGTLLATLPDNTTPFRFIGISGFDIVGRDTSSGVRRRSSMLKGSYEQAFYVGNQIQLATDAPQLIETNNKIDELILKIDTDLDAPISSRLATINYIDPDNTKIAEIKTKVDTLSNYDDSTTQTKLDTIQTSINDIDIVGVTNDLIIINENVKDASIFIPASRNL